MKLRVEGRGPNSSGLVHAVISVVDDADRILYQDKANLSSQKSRDRLTKAIKERFPEIGDVEATLLNYLNELAAMNTSQSDDTPEFAEEELAEGKRLLAKPSLLDDLVDVTELAGHVGEEDNKKTLILVTISTRNSDKALSVVIKNPSSAGKSALVNAILEMLPQSWVVRFSRITANALFYLRNKDLSRKVLFIDEVAGSEDSGYAIRISISEGELSVLVTVKNPVSQQLEAQEIRIPAKCMAYVSTTTRVTLSEEDETRILDMFLDESEKQTKLILEAQAKPVDDERVGRAKRVAQAALWQLECIPVEVPYSLLLAKRFPTKKLRARRDFPKLLALIRACCLLHQAQRGMNQNGKLVATVQDYAIVRDLAKIVLSATLKGMTPQEEQVLDHILQSLKNEEFTVRNLRDSHPAISYDRLKKIVTQLRDKGTLSWNGKQGWESKYKFVEDSRTALELPTTEELAEYMNRTPDPDVPESPADAGSCSNQLGDEKLSPSNPETGTNGGDAEAPSATKGEPASGRPRGPRVQEATDTYDLEEALGMSKEAALAIWHRHGSPIVHLGPGENCMDLEKLLNAKWVKPEHLEKVRDWLNKKGG